VDDVAGYFNGSTRTIYRLIEEGGFPESISGGASG